MIGARWVVIGSVLAGCVFTPRPMIPLEGDETDSSSRADDASVSRDLGRASDSSTPRTDVGEVPADTAPPSFDASAGADIPGATTPDAGGAFDAGSLSDAAPFSDAAPAPDADASAGCDAAGDGGDGGRCVEDASPTDADASPADAEAGLSER